MNHFKLGFHKAIPSVLLFIYSASVCCGEIVNAPEKRIDTLSCSINNERDFSGEVTIRGSVSAQEDIDSIKSCLIGEVEVRRRMLSNSVTLIDLRPSEQFFDLKISGSLNFTPLEVKSKKFLRNHHLILVADTSNLITATSLCHKLRKSGYKKVNVFNNGLLNLSDKLVSRKGIKASDLHLSSISPKDFTSLKEKVKWLVLDVRDRGQLSNRFNDIYKDLKSISFSVKNKENIGDIKKTVNNHAYKDLHYVLLVSDKDIGRDGVFSYLKQNGINNVFHMEGGVSNYSKYLKTRKVFLARLKKGAMRNKSCNST